MSVFDRVLEKQAKGIPLSKNILESPDNPESSVAVAPMPPIADLMRPAAPAQLLPTPTPPPPPPAPPPVPKTLPPMAPKGFGESYVGPEQMLPAAPSQMPQEEFGASTRWSRYSPTEEPPEPEEGLPQEFMKAAAKTAQNVSADITRLNVLNNLDAKESYRAVREKLFGQRQPTKEENDIAESVTTLMHMSAEKQFGGDRKVWKLAGQYAEEYAKAGNTTDISIPTELAELSDADRKKFLTYLFERTLKAQERGGMAKFGVSALRGAESVGNAFVGFWTEFGPAEWRKMQDERAKKLSAELNSTIATIRTWQKKHPEAMPPKPSRQDTVLAGATGGMPSMFTEFMADRNDPPEIRQLKELYWKQKRTYDQWKKYLDDDEAQKRDVERIRRDIKGVVESKDVIEGGNWAEQGLYDLAAMGPNFAAGGALSVLNPLAGVAWWSMQIAPGTLDDLRRAGVKIDDTTQFAALAGSVPEAVVENLQWRTFSAPFKTALKQKIRAGMKDYLIKWAKESAKEWTTETAEELIQGVINIATREIASASQGQGLVMEQEAKNLTNEIRRAAVSLGLLIAPGRVLKGAIGAPGAYRGAQEGEYEKKAAALREAGVSEQAIRIQLAHLEGPITNKRGLPTPEDMQQLWIEQKLERMFPKKRLEVEGEVQPEAKPATPEDVTPQVSPAPEPVAPGTPEAARPATIPPKAETAPETRAPGREAPSPEAVEVAPSEGRAQPRPVAVEQATAEIKAELAKPVPTERPVEQMSGKELVQKARSLGIKVQGELLAPTKLRAEVKRRMEAPPAVPEKAVAVPRETPPAPEAPKPAATPAERKPLPGTTITPEQHEELRTMMESTNVFWHDIEASLGNRQMDINRPEHLAIAYRYMKRKFPELQAQMAGKAPEAPRAPAAPAAPEVAPAKPVEAARPAPAAPEAAAVAPAVPAASVAPPAAPEAPRAPAAAPAVPAAVTPPGPKVAPAAPELDWKTARAGSTYASPVSGQPMQVMVRKLRNKAEAETYAEAVGGQTMIDGPRSWAVVRPITGAQLSGALRGRSEDEYRQLAQRAFPGQEDTVEAVIAIQKARAVVHGVDPEVLFRKWIEDVRQTPADQVPPGSYDGKSPQRQVEELAAQDAPPAKQLEPEVARALRTGDVKLTPSYTLPAGARTVNNVEQAANLVAGIRDFAQERFFIVATDGPGNVLGVVQAGIGSTTGAIIHPISLSAALSIPGVRKLYGLHNHPSGDPKPSLDDMALGERLRDLAKAARVPLHLAVVGESKGYDFTDRMIEFDLKPENVGTEIPILDRTGISGLGLVYPRPMRTPQDLEPIIQHLGNRTGIILADQKNKPVGFVALTPNEMLAFRRGPAGKMLPEIHRANAIAGFLVLPEVPENQARKVADNVSKFLTQAGLRLTDVVYGSKENRQSYTGRGFEIEKGVDFAQGPAVRRQLLALHNLSGENVLHAIKLGGIPVPSLGITKAGLPFEGYGEITLISSPEMVTPSRMAKVYGSDIYSPRYPNVRVRFNKSETEKLGAYLDEVVKRYPGTKSGFAGKRPGLTEAWDIAQQAESSDWDRTLSESLLMRIAYMEETGQAKPEWRTMGRDDLLRDVHWYDHPDGQATFKEWAMGLPDRLGMVTKEVVWQQRPDQDNGRYVAHTMENVTKMLRRKLRSGEGFNYGPGNIRALVTPQFRSLAGIRKAAGQLVSKEDIEKTKDEAGNELVALANEAHPYLKYARGFGDLDAFTEHIAEGVETGGWSRVWSEYYDNLPQEIKNKVYDYLNKLRGLPTEYFEAKILRPVGVNEFSHAVVPKNASQAVKDALRTRGIPITEYDPSVPGDRAAKVGQAGEQSGLLFQSELGFYSGTAKAVENLRQMAMPASQFRNWLAKQPGVKQEELDDLGLLEWLETKVDELVSKAEVLKFIEDGGPKLEEVRTWGKAPVAYEDSAKRLEDAGFTIETDEYFGTTVYRPDGTKVERIQLTAEQRRDVELLDEGVETEGEGVKFKGWTVPGGENYREVRVTLPQPLPFGKIEPDAKALADYKTEWERAEDEAIKARDAAQRSLSIEAGDREERADQALKAIHEKMVSETALRMGPQQTMPFRAGHWDEANVIAHFRLTDRKVDGKRVLFIEEIQSDWHQKGREQGYMDVPRLQKANLRRKDIGNEIGRLQSELKQMGLSAEFKTAWRGAENVLSWRDKRGGIVGSIDGQFRVSISDRAETSREIVERIETIADLQRQLADLTEFSKAESAKIPPGPFKRTESWTMLAFKRILRMAAEQGYDSVAWTPGDVQANRYDLSQQIDTLRYEDAGEGKYSLFAEKGGRTILERKEIPAAELSGVVGKDVAKRIQAGEGRTDEEGAKYLTGLQLQVGGEGMRSFYDVMLPKAVGKYMDKLEKGTIVRKPAPAAPQQVYEKVGKAPPAEKMDETTYRVVDQFARYEPKSQTWRIFNREGLPRLGTGFVSREDAIKWMQDYYTPRGWFVGDPAKPTEFTAGPYDTEGAAREAAKQARFSGATVWSVDLTPGMKDRILQGQPLYQGNRGAVWFNPDTGRAVIHAFESADRSTLVHETAHIFRRDLTPNELRTAEKLYGVKMGKTWTRAQEERFARDFEKYLQTGRAPLNNPTLKGVFEKFKTWLTAIYGKIRSQLAPEKVAFFDAMLGKPPISENEKAALRLANDPKALEKRLRQALKHLGAGAGYTFDFAGKRMVSPDGARAIVWKTRRYPSEPESYENQQTTVGTYESVTLVGTPGYKPTPEGPGVAPKGIPAKTEHYKGFVIRTEQKGGGFTLVDPDGFARHFGSKKEAMARADEWLAPGKPAPEVAPTPTAKPTTREEWEARRAAIEAEIKKASGEDMKVANPEAEVLEALRDQELSAKQLAEKLGKDIEDVASVMTDLEDQGLLTRKGSAVGSGWGDETTARAEFRPFNLDNSMLEVGMEVESSGGERFRITRADEEGVFGQSVENPTVLLDLDAEFPEGMKYRRIKWQPDPNTIPLPGMEVEGEKVAAVAPAPAPAPVEAAPEVPEAPRVERPNGLDSFQWDTLKTALVNTGTDAKTASKIVNNIDRYLWKGDAAELERVLGRNPLLGNWFQQTFGVAPAEVAAWMEAGRPKKEAAAPAPEAAPAVLDPLREIKKVVLANIGGDYGLKVVLANIGGDYGLHVDNVRKMPADAGWTKEQVDQALQELVDSGELRKEGSFYFSVSAEKGKQAKGMAAVEKAVTDIGTINADDVAVLQKLRGPADVAMRFWVEKAEDPQTAADEMTPMALSPLQELGFIEGRKVTESGKRIWTAAKYAKVALPMDRYVPRNLPIPETDASRYIDKEKQPNAAYITGTVNRRPAWTNTRVLFFGPPPSKAKAFANPDLKMGDAVPSDLDAYREVAPTYFTTGQDVRQGTMSPGTVVLGDLVTIDSRYYDYTVKNYPDAKFLIQSAERPVVVQQKGKVVGVIMPIRLREGGGAYASDIAAAIGRVAPAKLSSVFRTEETKALLSTLYRAGPKSKVTITHGPEGEKKTETFEGIEEVPGLVAMRLPETKGWGVVHRESGLWAAKELATEKTARFVARLLNSTGVDWTKTGEELNSQFEGKRLGEIVEVATSGRWKQNKDINTDAYAWGNAPEGVKETLVRFLQENPGIVEHFSGRKVFDVEYAKKLAGAVEALPPEVRARLIPEAEYEKSRDIVKGLLYQGAVGEEAGEFKPKSIRPAIEVIARKTVPVGSWHFEEVARNADVPALSRRKTWNERMIADMGPGIEPYLPDIWSAMKKDRESILAAVKGSEAPLTEKPEQLQTARQLLAYAMQAERQAGRKEARAEERLAAKEAAKAAAAPPSPLEQVEGAPPVLEGRQVGTQAKLAAGVVKPSPAVPERQALKGAMRAERRGAAAGYRAGKLDAKATDAELLDYAKKYLPEGEYKAVAQILERIIRGKGTFGAKATLVTAVNRLADMAARRGEMKSLREVFKGLKKADLRPEVASLADDLLGGRLLKNEEIRSRMDKLAAYAEQTLGDYKDRLFTEEFRNRMDYVRRVLDQAETLRDLTTEEVRDLTGTLNDLLEANTNRIRRHFEAKAAEHQADVEAAVGEVKKVKPEEVERVKPETAEEEKRPGIIRQLSSLRARLNLSNLLRSVFGKGQTTTAAFENLYEAQGKSIEFESAAHKTVADKIRGLGLSAKQLMGMSRVLQDTNWVGKVEGLAGLRPGLKTVKVELPSARVARDNEGNGARELTSIELTPAERMTILGWNRDPRVRQWIAEGVGIRRRGKEDAGVIFLGEEDLRAIERSATREEKAIIDTIMGLYSGEFREALDKANLDLKGFTPPLPERMYPIHRSGMDVEREPNEYWRTYAEMNMQPRHAGTLKPRTGGKPAILLGDAFADFGEHTAHIAAYTQKQAAFDRARRLFEDKAVQTEVISRTKNGRELLGLIKDKIVRAGSFRRSRGGKMNAFVAPLVHNVHGALLVYKPHVAIGQMASTNKLRLEFDTGTVAKGVGAAVSDLGKDAKRIIGLHSPTLQRRITGQGYELLTAGVNSRQVAEAFGSRYNYLSDLGKKFIQMGDNVVTFAAVEMAKIEGRNKGLTGEALDRYAAKRAEQAVRDTQATADVLTISSLMDEANDVQAYKLVPGMMFNTERSKTFNLLMQEVYKYRDSGKTVADKVRLAKAIQVVVVDNMLYRAIKVGSAAALMGIAALVFGARDDDKDKWSRLFSWNLRNVLSSDLPSLYPVVGDVGGMLLDATVRKMRGEPVRDILKQNPVAGPLTQGMEGASDVLAGIWRWNEPYKQYRPEGKGEVQFWRGLPKLTEGVGTLTGLPVPGVRQLARPFQGRETPESGFNAGYSAHQASLPTTSVNSGAILNAVKTMKERGTTVDQAVEALRVYLDQQKRTREFEARAARLREAFSQ